MSTDANHVDHAGHSDYQIHTEIEIDTPASVVWDTLTDFERMPEWSDSFQGLTGDFREGGQITAHFKMLGHDQTFEHTLFDFIEGQQWAWSDPLMLGMVDHHVYRVEPITETTSRFIQTDQMKGGHLDHINRMLANQTYQMYEQFNAQLKAEAERRYAESTA